MSVSNDVPAQSAVAQPVTYPQFVVGVAPGGDVRRTRPPVRRRVTWGLSMMCGVGGWLLIVGTSVLGVYNTLTAANEDEAALREYGFGVAIVLMLLCSSSSTSSVPSPASSRSITCRETPLTDVHGWALQSSCTWYPLA